MDEKTNMEELNDQEAKRLIDNLNIEEMSDDELEETSAGRLIVEHPYKRYDVQIFCPKCHSDDVQSYHYVKYDGKKQERTGRFQNMTIPEFIKFPCHCRNCGYNFHLSDAKLKKLGLHELED